MLLKDKFDILVNTLIRFLTVMRQSTPLYTKNEANSTYLSTGTRTQLAGSHKITGKSPIKQEFVISYTSVY